MKSVLSALGIIFILVLAFHLFVGSFGMWGHWRIPGISTRYTQNCGYTQYPGHNASKRYCNNDS